MMLDLLLRELIRWARKTPASFLLTTITFVAVMLTMVGAYQVLLDHTEVPNFYRDDLLVLDAEIREIRDDIALLKASPPADISLAPAMPEVTTAIAALESRVDALNDRVERFYGLLLDRPELLVTLPLVKQDVEAIQNRLDGLADAVNSTNDSIQWFVSIFLTLIATVIGIFVTNLNRRGESSGESTDGSHVRPTGA